MELPSLFQKRMKDLLGEEYEEFVDSYEKERSQGLRLNLLKTDVKRFLAECPFSLRRIPWVEEGFYYDGKDRPGRHPWHEAGVYYIQEPSAMAVVTFLDPKPGECILDLCAAPGGKTSHIASRLGGTGFLLSNEIHPARAKILSQNVERMGAVNTVVTNEDAGRLEAYFPEFFDRIVVDAPCSGEGMFRKDEEARNQWSPDNVKLCAKRQQEILAHAAGMLRAGGRLVYSTCTFAPDENEKTVEQFLALHPEFSVEPVELYEGMAAGNALWSDTGRKELNRTVRIWPHRTEGEGHFIAVLRKSEGLGAGDDGAGLEDNREREVKSSGRYAAPKSARPVYLTDKAKDRPLLKEFYEFCGETLREADRWKNRKELIFFGEQLYLLPPQMPAFDGLRVVRPGLHLGTRKKNRFEPSHALALSLQKEEVRVSRTFHVESLETAAYLRGEALADPGCMEDNGSIGDKGWTLITVDGYSIGWAKLTGGVLKNHYPKGLRK